MPSLGKSGQFNDVLDSSYVSGNITVGTSEILAAAVGGVNLILRQELLIFNRSSAIIYFGPTGVTTATGIPVGPNEVLNLPYGQSISVYLIAGTAGNTVTVQEMA